MLGTVIFCISWYFQTQDSICIHIICFFRSLDPLFNSCTDGNGIEDVIEVAPVLHLQNDGANLKPLILFEDVDICFAEDRGLISAIQQIAEKAKGPVVLTANGNTRPC